jgi:hypothetical protein
MCLKRCPYINAITSPIATKAFTPGHFGNFGEGDQPRRCTASIKFIWCTARSATLPSCVRLNPVSLSGPSRGVLGPTSARQGPVKSHCHLRKTTADGTTPAMSGKYPAPVVTIRRYPASRICDVLVVVRGQEMVLRCPSYSHALKWARLECKSYNIPELLTDIEPNEDVP